MDENSGYAGALAALAGGGDGPTPGAASSPPPPMGMPPPPLGIGAMPTGDPASDPKSAVADAVLALQTVKKHFPQAQDRIDGMVAEMQSLSKPQAGGAPSGAPAPSQGGGAPVAPPPVG